MKLNSLKTVLAMTAALGIAFVGISCKPKSDGGGDAKPEGDAPKKEEAAQKDAPKTEEGAKKEEGEKKKDA